jgi:hypothetical protein
MASADNKISVKMTKNIRQYHEYVILNFNFKETISAVLIILVAVVCFLVVSPTFGDTIATIIMFILTLPIAFFGIFKIHGIEGYKLLLYYLNFMSMPNDLTFSSKSKYRALVDDYNSKSKKPKKNRKAKPDS